MDNNLFSESLRGKRIGLVDCESLGADFTTALSQAHTSFANIAANSIDPGAPELNRFDALVLGVADGAAESAWLQPEAARKHVRPLLLAGTPEAIYCRETLQGIADDVILRPFSSFEFLFRLHRITRGKSVFAETAMPTGRPIVLVVDDDLNVTNYLACMLKSLDVESYFVSDGQTALAAARQLLPDLMLLDIALPIMSGLEVLARLRDDPGTRNLATVLLTSSSDLSDVEKGASLGVLDYILKPFGHISLTRKLKAFLRIATPLSYA